MKLSQFAENLAEARSRQIIRIGFSMVMVIIGFIVFFGLNRLTIVHESLAEIVNNEQFAIEMLFRMQQSSRDRSVVLYKITTTQDPFERDEQLMNFANLGSQFGEARRKLRNLKLDASEKALLDEQRGHIATSLEIQQRVIDLATTGDSQAAHELLNSQALPVQEKILEIINTLLEHEITESHEHAAQLQKQQGQTRTFMASAGIIGAIFVGFIAAFINRRTTVLVAGLAASASELREANQSLESLKLAVDHHDIVSIADVHGNITYVNEKFCQISEYSKEELIGQNHRILNSGIHPKSFFEDMWGTISSGKVWQQEICNQNKSGKPYWVATTIVPFLDDSGLPYQYISVRTDITAIKEAQQVLLRGKNELEKLVQDRTVELQEREEVLHSITNAAQDAVIMIDSDGIVTYWNPAAENMFGYASNEISGRNLHSLVVPSRYLDAHHAAFPKFIQTGTGALIGATTEVQALRRDGSEFPIEISVSSVKIKGNWHAVAIVRDITARKLAEDRLKQFATTDTLTGACNRRRFNEVIYSELSRAKRYRTPLSLLIFDIDHFKNINDTFGHQTGDQVLVQLSALVSSNLRDTDVFARWGGEEFTILATNCDSLCTRQFAEKLRLVIENYPFPGVGKVTCSFGVTEYREDDDQESIIRRADNSLYRAKEGGRNRVEIE